MTDHMRVLLLAIALPLVFALSFTLPTVQWQMQTLANMQLAAIKPTLHKGNSKIFWKWPTKESRTG